MKKKGNTSDFISHRNRELHKNFLHILRTDSNLPLHEMFGAAAERPSPRFWVSEGRAADVIGCMMRGDSLQDMIPKRREMFEEIFRRVRELMEAAPGLCMTHAVSEVVFQEAPEFYMTPETARTIIYRMRRQAKAMKALRRKINHDSLNQDSFNHDTLN